MRSFLITIVLCLSAFGGSAQEPAMATHGIRTWESRTELFTNARIVVAPGRALDNASMLVVDGVIEAVGVDLATPPGVVPHDLGGRTIYAGFIDPYTEYGLEDVGRLNERKSDGAPRYEADDRGRAHWNEAVHAEREWSDRFRPDPEAAGKLMARGVSTVQTGKMDGVFRGAAFVASLEQDRSSELILKPISTQWLSFDKGSSQMEYPSSLMGSIALIRQTMYDARWARQYPAAAEPVADAVRSISSWNGPWVFESGDELSLLRAAAIGREFDLPLIFIGSNREFQRLDAVRAVNAPIILPLSFPEVPKVKTIEDELDVTLEDLRVWERAPSNPAVLAEAGVRFAFTGHGLRKDEDFLANLRTVIKRGLPAEAALAALTTIPAELSGVSNLVGTLEKGKRADFLVVDGDLFAEEGEATIESVWIRGRLAKELIDDDARDFRGTYEVTLGDRTYTVRLTGEKAKLEGEIAEGETVVELENIKASLDSLTFQAPMDEFDVEGVARFSVNAVRDEIVGKANLPGGMPIAVMMGRKPVEEEKPESTVAVADATVGDEEKETVRDEPLISRTTYPNIGLGYDAVPVQENVLVRNATVWTMEDDGVLPNTDVLFVDGKVSRIGADLAAPAGVRVIDATGKHLTPGMIDEHSHLAISRGVNEGSHSVTAEVRIGDVVNSDDVGMYRALAGGTTMAQLLHGSANPIGGQAQVIKFRWGHPPEELKFDAAPPSIKFALGENVKQANWGEDYRCPLSADQNGRRNDHEGSVSRCARICGSVACMECRIAARAEHDDAAAARPPARDSGRDSRRKAVHSFALVRAERGAHADAPCRGARVHRADVHPHPRGLQGGTGDGGARCRRVDVLRLVGVQVRGLRRDPVQPVSDAEGRCAYLDQFGLIRADPPPQPGGGEVGDVLRHG